MIILASTSPRRIELIRQITQFYKIEPPYADELQIAETPYILATQNARLKALSIPRPHGEIVLGADTIVVYSGQVLGKPNGEKDARIMLESLNGNTHTVISGVCVASGKGVFCDYEQSFVTFNKLSDKLISDYINSGLYKGKAGGYGLQDGYGLVAQVKGEPDNVIGLPLKLCRRLIVSAGGGQYLL